MNLIQALLRLLPTIIQAIHFAEMMFPAQGAGLQKLDLVATTIGKVAESTPEIKEHAQALVDAVKPVVSNVVSTFNQLGIFDNKPSAV